MELTIIIDYIIISIIASMAINSILRNYAKKYNFLVALPDRSRKFHKRPTPMTGGAAILVSLLITGKLYIDLNNLNGYLPDFTLQLMLVSIPLLLLFLVDDLKGLRPLLRITIQSLVTVYMIFTTDVYLQSFGIYLALVRLVLEV
jgi:UDP-GlcNAc:undecaprenyl-phosphate GlcNAc-1-phosphate transferase